VYNEYGCQITGEMAEAILENINRYQELEDLPMMLSYETAEARDLYHVVDDMYHQAYQKQCWNKRYYMILLQKKI
jgi:hypothetical protein